MTDETYAVSVIIPNWNGAKFLETCLNSLRRQSFQEFKTILIDNGSTDTSVVFVRDNFPEVLLITLDWNHGFSEAVNRGIAHANTPFVALLNNDTETASDWLEKGIAALREHPEAGFVACQVRDFFERNRLDSAGDIITRTGLPLKRGMDEMAQGEFLKQRFVLGASAGAALYRREVLERIGEFDTDYFMYLEDVDWSLRAALQGVKCLYAPAARVYHIEGGSDPSRQAFLERGNTKRQDFHTQNRTYWITRNRVRLLVKNYPAPLILKLSPWLLFGFLRSALFHLLKSGLFGAFARGLLKGLAEIPQCLPLRHSIQDGRTVSSREFEKVLLS